MPMSNDNNPLITRAAEEVTSTSKQKLGKTLLTFGIGMGLGVLSYKYGPFWSAVVMGTGACLIGIKLCCAAKLAEDAEYRSKLIKKSAGYIVPGMIGLCCVFSYSNEQDSYREVMASARNGIGQELSKAIIAGQTEVTRSRTISGKQLTDWIEHDYTLTGGVKVWRVNNETGVLDIQFEGDVPMKWKEVSRYRIEGKKLVPLAAAVK